METLLYGLLLPSGNDAAIALAQHVAGTQAAVHRDDEREARELGLTCTHFTTVSGIVDAGQLLVRRPTSRCSPTRCSSSRCWRGSSARAARSLPFPIKGGKLYLYNNNPLLLAGYPGTDGVKTGFTDAAGQCLVAAARRGRAWLGVVLLHSRDPADQAEKLLNAGFARGQSRRVATHGARQSPRSCHSSSSHAPTRSADAGRENRKPWRELAAVGAQPR